MFRRFDIKIFLMMFLNIVYVYMISAINTELSPEAYLLLPALFIIPSALFLNFIPMTIVVIFSALLLEASTPARTGATAALWIVAAYAVHNMRFRFRACDWFSITALEIAVNVIIVFIYSLFFFRDAENIFVYAVRVSTDIAASSAALILIAKFSVSLPVSIANLCGINMSIGDEQ